MKGKIHSIESFGSVDGPGVRFIIFMQGCKMRCAYCHNPDSWKCGIGEEKTADEILDQAERYRSYWGEKGGITVSGGEALLQIDFLIELFEKAHERGINTCLDTAGQPFTHDEPFFSKFKTLIQNTDTVLFDIKHIDDDAHRQLTGHTNKNILECVRCIDEMGVKTWIRHVLVPGYTDDENALHRLRAFIDTLKNVERVEVLPYHTMGRFKYEKLGIAYRLEGVEPPSKECIEKARTILGAL